MVDGGPSRRDVLRVAALASGAVALGMPSGTGGTAEAAGAKLLLGAIRWDAWVGGDWAVGSQVNRTLSPKKYEFRLPYYAGITVPNRVLIDEPAQTLLHDESTTQVVELSRPFTPQSRAVTVEWDWKETVAGRWARAILVSGSSAAVDIATRSDASGTQLVYRASDGTWKVLQTVADDTWYSLKVIADPAPPQGATPWVDIFVDGVRRANHVPLLGAMTSFDRLSLRTNETLTSDLYIRNLSVEVTESVNANGAVQSVMDQEIHYAAAAGIDYWAFVYYPLSAARNLYLSSAYKNDVNWCAILDGNFTGTFDANLPPLASQFSTPNYQKVLGGRPLVYFLSGADADKVAKLRAKAAELGVANPYVVVMGWTAQGAADLKTTVGADAVSRYATGSMSGAPYSDLAAAESGLWDQYATAAGQVIPTVSTGWDKRPRYDYPVSWEPDYTGFKDTWTQQATPAQIASHLGAAVSWTKAHPASTAASTALIYAWNEFDEGGWICPTLVEIRDSGAPLRLNAIAGVSRTTARRGRK